MATLTIEEWKAEQQLLAYTQFLSMAVVPPVTQEARRDIICEQPSVYTNYSTDSLAWIATHNRQCTYHLLAKRGCADTHWMASLILAQDQRWRRA